MRARDVAVVGSLVCMLGSCGGGSKAPEVEASEALHAAHAPVGLSLFFRDGQMGPITLVGSAPRYLQEIDVTASVTTSTDQGLTPLTTSGELASLDWTGVTQVEEEWFPQADGTFTRERYYRNARWMEEPSGFVLLPETAAPQPVGVPIVAFAGTDNQWGALDDGFTRRFTARQLATG